MAEPTFQNTTFQATLAPNQRLYLTNAGMLTSATLHSAAIGQQQQSTNQFSTGCWSAPPQLYALAYGWIVAIASQQGLWYLQIQGSQMQMSNQPPSEALAAQLKAQQPEPMQPTSKATVPSGNMPPMQPMEPMQPMQPMEPMQPLPPMTMTMGNMTMSTGTLNNATPAGIPNADQAADTTAQVKKFCPQCGAATLPQANFCANCGHQLSAG
ncbi:MAG: zinc ribbon domain-containing protein [Cyanobacteria bacterium J06634_6]